MLRHGLRIANLHQTLNCNIKRSFTPVIGELEDVAGAAGRISVNVTGKIEETPKQKLLLYNELASSIG